MYSLHHLAAGRREEHPVSLGCCGRKVRCGCCGVVRKARGGYWQWPSGSCLLVWTRQFNGGSVSPGLCVIQKICYCISNCLLSWIVNVSFSFGSVTYSAKHCSLLNRRSPFFFICMVWRYLYSALTYFVILLLQSRRVGLLRRLRKIIYKFGI